MPAEPFRVALVGPTASGKSALALAVARQQSGVELVSVDSMQVYRSMNIGTAKPTRAERDEVPHHLIDLVEPHEEFTVVAFRDAYRVVDAQLARRDARGVLVGGTALYLRAIVDELELPGRFPEVRAELEANPDTAALHERLHTLDPVAADRMEPTNRRRVLRALEVTLGAQRPFSSFGPGLSTHPPTEVRIVGLDVDRTVLDRRIQARLEAQLAAGWLDEVRALCELPHGLSHTARQALGYRELLAHLEDGVDLDEAITTTLVRTRRFARRQQRWLRRDPRIRWVSVTDQPLDHLDDVIEAFGW